MMTMTAPTFSSLGSMLRMALGRRLEGTTESFADMVAEDVVMEFPYAPPGPARVEGAETVMAHLKVLGERVTFSHLNEPVVHETTDPDVVVIEVDGFGQGVATGAPHHQQYIYVIRTRGGRIVHFKDYWNPVAYLRAL